MKPGPQLAKKIFVENLIQIDSPPKSATEWLVEIIQLQGWYTIESEIIETAEKWQGKFLMLLRTELNTLHQFGRFYNYTFNSSSDYMIQGFAYPEPKDSDRVKQAKTRRTFFKEYTTALKLLHPRDFEALCAGILSVMGVKQPKLTRYSADEGIDFYGKLHLENLLFPNAVFPSIQRQLSIWIIGQAKHYIASQGSTPEIRDLVGAIELAKGRAFGSSDDKFSDLRIRVCDPVFYLFITTGRITGNSWKLLTESGVIGMDGEMVASFLCDHSIGVTSNVFDYKEFYAWIKNI